MDALFLDIDGVLNSDEYIDKVKKLSIEGIESEIDVNKIKLLKRVVEETGAVVVLTSSWRYTRKAQDLKDLLSRYEIYVDSTPFINNKRGLEIKKWLEDNPNVENYVILDDEIFDSYDEELMDHLIKISSGNGYNFGEGLLLQDVDKIIDRLRNKNIKKIQE